MILNCTNAYFGDFECHFQHGPPDFSHLRRRRHFPSALFTDNFAPSPEFATEAVLVRAASLDLLALARRPPRPPRLHASPQGRHSVLL